MMEVGTMGSHKQNNNKAVVEARVGAKMGLHARPAMQFADLANKFVSNVRVCKDRQCVNAKSIMELLLLAASEGTKLTIHAEGCDAHKAVDTLKAFVEGRFDEE